jgi:tetratricopeptide (TPR) repeat protein
MDDRADHGARVAQGIARNDEVEGVSGGTSGPASRILERTGEMPTSLASLERDSAHGWEEMAARLREQADAADTDAESCALLARRARLFEEKIADPEAALDAWRGVLRANPSHLAALRAIVDLERASETATTEQRVTSLCRLLEHAGHILDDEERALRMGELAELRAKRGEWDDAVEQWTRLLELDVGDAAARRGATCKLAAALAEVFDDPEQALDLLLDAVTMGDVDPAILADVEVLARRTSRFAEAIATVTAVLDGPARAHGHDPRPRLALARMQEAQGRIDAACATLDEALFRAAGWQAQKSVSIALAELHERARRDPRAAEAHYLRARTLDPEDADRRVLEGLARVSAATGAYAQLAEVQDRLIEVAEGSEGQLRALLEGAAARLERALEIDPESDAAYVSLAHCYRKLRLWDAAAFAYQRHIEATADDAGRVEAWMGLAGICESELCAPDRALEAYRAVLELEPNHAGALAALARLHERRGEIAQARVLHRAALDVHPCFLPSLGALRRIAARLGDKEELATLLDREQRYTPNERARARLLVELGRLRQDELDDPRGALHAFEEAIELDPDNADAARAIAEDSIARRDFGRAEPLLARLTRTAARAPVGSAGEKNRLFAMYGRTLEAIGKPKRAIEAYRQALAAVPSDVDSLRGIARMAEIEPEPVARAALFVDVANAWILADDLGEATAAIEHALSACPDDRPLLHRLMQLQHQTRAWAGLYETLERIAALDEDPSRRAKYLATAAQIQRERLRPDDSQERRIEPVEDDDDEPTRDRKLCA